MESYTSATDRLAELPAIFRGADLTIRFSWRPAIASTYLAQWRRRNLVASLGGRTDIHFNLLAQRQPDLEEGLRMLFPAAIRVGDDVLRQEGWTTQIPSAPEVAIPANWPMYKIEVFRLSRRSDAWFKAVARVAPQPTTGLRVLAAAWAFADMVARGSDRRVNSASMLAPDDLDFDQVSGAKGLRQALDAFGLSHEVASPQGYAEVYDEWWRSRYGQEEHSGAVRRQRGA